MPVLAGSARSIGAERSTLGIGTADTHESTTAAIGIKVGTKAIGWITGDKIDHCGPLTWTARMTLTSRRVGVALPTGQCPREGVSAQDCPLNRPKTGTRPGP